MEEDYKHPDIPHSTGRAIELDLYIEELKLAAEYQGEHHYKPLYWTGVDYAAQKRRDEEKRKGCREVKFLC